MASSSSSPDMEDAFELTQVDTQAATQVEEELSQEVVDPDTSTEVVDNDENSMDLEGTQIDAEAPTQVEDFENIGNEIKVEESFDNENVKNELFEDYNDFKISDDNNDINSRENLKLRRKKSFHNEIDTNLKSEDDYSNSCSDTDSDVTFCDQTVKKIQILFENSFVT